MNAAPIGLAIAFLIAWAIMFGFNAPDLTALAGAL